MWFYCFFDNLISRYLKFNYRQFCQDCTSFYMSRGLFGAKVFSKKAVFQINFGIWEIKQDFRYNFFVKLVKAESYVSRGSFEEKNWKNGELFAAAWTKHFRNSAKVLCGVVETEVNLSTGYLAEMKFFYRTIR